MAQRLPWLVSVLVVVSASACNPSPAKGDHPAPAGSAPGATTAPRAPVPPLVVSIVIDQEAAWIADERWPLLPKDGGFARLLREGTYAKDVRYAHAVTDTAPGHAALYTGAPPRVSGIWGNEIIDPTSHTKVSILRDATTKSVWTGAPPAFVGSSMDRARVDTVADRFRAAQKDALIVSLSLKDRGAIFGGGRAPTASLWYEKELDRFVTSTAFGQTFPGWADPLAVPTAVRAMPWTLLDPGWVQAHAATPDNEPGEGDLGGMPIVFPHDVAHAPSPTNAFRGSPFADDAIFELAIAAIDGEHAANRPTLLALSLSGNDYVGHAYGPDSWEAWDELRRLDASLAKFFAALDARLGPKGWAAILSGDHGVTTMPEATALPKARPWCHAGGKMGDAGADRWQRACGKVGRLYPEELGAEMREVAEKTVKGDAPLVLGMVDPYVYLTPAARALPPDDLARLKKAMTAALLKHPEVERVIDTATLPETCPPDSDESAFALVCRSYVPNGAGELYVLPKSGSFFDPDVVPRKGTSHGTPELFDRAVPLIVRAPGRAAAGRVIDEPLTFRAFARALSTLLGVTPPNPESAKAPDLAKAADQSR